MPFYKIKKEKKSNAENTAWKWFSLYIRTRDALETTGTLERARCFTCDEIHNIQELDAGHMIPGRSNGILFDESIVKAQCIKCNRHNGGEQQMFKFKMVSIHGEGWYDLKLKARKTPCKLSDMELRLIADTYREKYKDLIGK